MQAQLPVDAPLPSLRRSSAAPLGGTFEKLAKSYRRGIRANLPIEFTVRGIRFVFGSFLAKADDSPLRSPTIARDALGDKYVSKIARTTASYARNNAETFRKVCIKLQERVLRDSQIRNNLHSRVLAAKLLWIKLSL